MSSRDPDFAGMTTNERLFSTGLLGEWDEAIRVGDRASASALLARVDLGDQAQRIVDTVFADPETYGFPIDC